MKLATVTNEAGNYAARSLPYGNYQIGVIASGKDIELHISQSLTLDLAPAMC